MPDSSTVIHTTAGRVRGVDADGVTSWKGIPFAQPPIGPLRWRAPRPAEPWDDIREATEFGPAAPQIITPAIDLGADPVMNEDCLSLNVWRASEATEPLPVMVWIHGGAYTFGSTRQPLYDGTHFASTGEVVIVTINYRIGALGFLDLSSLSTADEQFDSNLALRDVLLALEWVRDNIAAFGGDPSRVTVFGESAGGGLVTTLLAVPSAEGLFHQAIAESSPVSSMYHSARAATVADRMLTQLHIDRSEPARLRDISADRIVAAGTIVYAAVPSEQPGTLAFAPVVDGELLPEHPVTVLSEGRGLPIPLMIGTNKDEASLFKFMKSPLMPINEQSITAMMEAIAAEKPDAELPTREHLLSAYAGVRAQAVGLGIARDIGFRMPTLWVAEGHSRTAPVWLYRFDFTTAMFRLIGLGATHAAELAYVWGNLDKKDVAFKLGGFGAGKALSRRMQARWRNFALTGTPTGPEGEPEWETFDTDRRATLVFDRSDALVDDLDAALRAAWGDSVVSFS
ncbi:MAG: carboxylesterase/lipase family protein [Rhodoglobus sp.]